MNETKKRLMGVFNLMQGVETHGESTCIMADCMRELINVINSIPEEKENGTE